MREFWSAQKAHMESRGVYMLAFKAGPGFTPIYVGKTNRDFYREVFNASNLNKYNSALNKYKKCTVVLFLMVYPPHRGAINKKFIDEAETFLIRLAQQANPNIKNTRKVDKGPKWAIQGINDSKRGRRSLAAQSLRRALNL